MKRKFNFNSIIADVGRPVVAHTPDGWYSSPYRALIQPLRYKNKMYLEGKHTDIGLSDTGYYLYIGPSDHDLTKIADDVVIICGNEKYVITRAERCFLGDEITHIWAILRSVVEWE